MDLADMETLTNSNSDLQAFISQYKSFVKSPDYSETYKWEVFQNFQNHWDIEAPDFRKMIENAINHRVINLWQSMNYFPRKMLLLLAEQFPEEVRSMFRALDNESRDLRERISEFRDEADRLQALSNPNLQAYQDFRAVMLYLCLLRPDQYFLFKSSMFRGFCKSTGFWQINAKQGKDPAIVLEYLAMCQKVRSILVQDTDLIDSYQNSERVQRYPDKAMTLLTQDFIYVVSTEIPKEKEISDEEEDDSFQPIAGQPTYWLLAPGEQAMYWDDFYQNGYASIDFNIGDLSILGKEEI